MYTFEKQYTGWGAVFPGNECTSAHMGGQVLTSEGKICSLRTSFTMNGTNGCLEHGIQPEQGKTLENVYPLC